MADNGKPKVAFFDFACCEGCQLTVIDALQTHLELVEAVEIVQFREAMTEKGEDYLVAFIEGSCTRKEDEERLKKIREQAAIVVDTVRRLLGTDWTDLTIGGFAGEVDGTKIRKKLRLLNAEGVAFQNGRLADPKRVFDFSK